MFNQEVTIAYLCSTNVILIFFILFREQSLTIKVYGPTIVCASQFFPIESFKLDVIEKTVSACRRNYNMQMILLFMTIPPIPLDVI